METLSSKGKEGVRGRGALAFMKYKHQHKASRAPRQQEGKSGDWKNQVHRSSGEVMPSIRSSSDGESRVGRLLRRQR